MSAAPLDILLHHYREKTKKAATLFLHSAKKLPPFNPILLNSPDALEPYDALAGRFERVVELILQPLLKLVEKMESGLVSETVRDRLHFAAKLGLITDVELWLEMRGARNRMAHDYLPDQIKTLHDRLRTVYRSEIESFLSRFEKYAAQKRESP
jgi:hypothetical protein